MKPTQRDLIAESIADYESMSDTERGKMTITMMEDQPVLMGFITELADDFTDEEHETLVDSVVILSQAFVAAGIPIDLIPKQLVNEVIEEKTDLYENRSMRAPAEAENFTDSPKVFQDLRHRAILRAGLAKEPIQAQTNYCLVLDTIITIIERSITAEYNKGEGNT